MAGYQQMQQLSFEPMSPHRSPLAGPRLLVPPYVHFEPPRPQAPLGAILVADITGDAPAIAQLTAYAHLLPWCAVAICVRGERRVSGSWARALERLPTSSAWLTLRSDEPLTTQMVLSAVTGRTPLTPDQFARWIAERIGRPGLAALFAAAIEMTPRRGVAALTSGYALLRARLRSLGPLKANDWRSAYYLAAWAGHPRISLAECAEQLGMDVWTLRREIERIAGVSLEEQRALRGWEWFGEATLRTAGLVAVTRAVPAEGEEQAQSW